MNLVLLHGPVAAGKLTTARAPSTRLGYPVFHNGSGARAEARSTGRCPVAWRPPTS